MYVNFAEYRPCRCLAAAAVYCAVIGDAVWRTCRRYIGAITDLFSKLPGKEMGMGVRILNVSRDYMTYVFSVM